MGFGAVGELRNEEGLGGAVLRILPLEGLGDGAVEASGTSLGPFGAGLDVEAFEDALALGCMVAYALGLIEVVGGICLRFSFFHARVRWKVFGIDYQCSLGFLGLRLACPLLLRYFRRLGVFRVQSDVLDVRGVRLDPFEEAYLDHDEDHHKKVFLAEGHHMEAFPAEEHREEVLHKEEHLEEELREEAYLDEEHRKEHPGEEHREEHREEVRHKEAFLEASHEEAYQVAYREVAYQVASPEAYQGGLEA